jgi:hypothetical protein
MSDMFCLQTLLALRRQEEILREAQLARFAREACPSTNAGIDCSGRHLPSWEDTWSSGGNSCQPYPG